ncbi:MAG: M20 family metallo-hydrolase [Prevotella sp.]|uniref:M20 family metallo-hydrolase n=1 Tax=Prevotella sp. PTAC TaxID=2736295 RepID=UPI0015527FB6|nr:M20 family metallo-hydrolase [Prevotella sp. PTAC]MCX4292791.1 M20 family metallo-hydrolase [Prevotella sp.]NPD54932.1 M20 family metallo-hydrolase [Prevotella sp. PTAC]
MTHDNYVYEAVELLKKLIATPSVSRDESRAADIIEDYMTSRGLAPRREANNVFAVCDDYDESKPTMLLNAHIDTVKPVATWTRDPFAPEIDGDRLYGLGSNDCGGGLTALLQAYRAGLRRKREYNIVYVASAEEEVSGSEGIVRVLPLLPEIDIAMVGEPTGMQPAIAEKGLMVIDGTAHGRSGHAARDEGINAINEALDDLMWLRDYRFERVSRLLGAVKMSVTMITAGTQHNVVPDECRFVIDVRTNELYDNREVFDIIRSHLHSDVKARSFRLNSSGIDACHPLVRRMTDMGMRPFGSPTLSDQALMPFPSLKLGPGESCRSHSADEFICISEIAQAIETYLMLI